MNKILICFLGLVLILFWGFQNRVQATVMEITGINGSYGDEVITSASHQEYGSQNAGYNIYTSYGPSNPSGIYNAGDSFVYASADLLKNGAILSVLASSGGLNGYLPNGSDAISGVWDTLIFKYTGNGPAPSTLSTEFNWNIDASIKKANSYNFGTANIGITGALNGTGNFLTIYNNGSYNLTAPFTVDNGGSIFVTATLYAQVYSSVGGSVYLDPQFSLLLPPGWTAFTPNEGLLTPTPEPPTVWLMATGILGMFGWAGYRRIKAPA